MADVDDGDAFGFQVLNDGKQGLYLALAQRAGRLIEDEHLAVRGHRLGDFNRLHLGNRQAAQLLLGVEIHPDLLKQPAGVLVHGLMIHQRDETQQALQGITAHVYVFSDGPLGDRLKLLVHHRDAQFQRLQRVVNGDLLPLVDDLPFIHLVDAEHALHQRGLAGAVFAHQGVDGARPKLELRFVQRLDAGKGFGYIPHFQAVLAHV